MKKGILTREEIKNLVRKIAKTTNNDKAQQTLLRKRPKQTIEKRD
jgi:hypothetical protein